MRTVSVLDLDQHGPVPILDDDAPRTPSGRLLHLLSLLQKRPSWSGTELSVRLGVTTRTVRRDVDRLRALGYPVDATPGREGGYQLGPGATLPPLLLEDDEATAAALALRTAATGPVAGIEEAALSALSKLDRVLPPHLRRRVEMLRDATVYLGADQSGVDPEVLVTAAHASATSERLRLTYRDRRDRLTERRIEPHRLVCTGRRWYLVARDVDRVNDEAGGWRTFRADRVVELTGTGHRFRLDDPPDAAELVATSIASAPYEHTARVRFEAPADTLRSMIPASVGTVEAEGDDACIFETGVDEVRYLAGHLVSVGIPFEVLEPAPLREHLQRLGAHLARVHARSPG
jgi:predicted DNA-binding transcriptional regulator YafY